MHTNHLSLWSKFLLFQKTRKLRDSWIKHSFGTCFELYLRTSRRYGKQYSLKIWAESLIHQTVVVSSAAFVFKNKMQFPIPLQVYNIVYSNCLAPPPPVGSVWSWGDGDFGKLGRGGSDSCKAPKLITNFNAEVAKVRCGSQFSIALTRDGRVFTWWEEMHLILTGSFVVH